MIKITYASNLYKSITELVRYVGERYEDITRNFGKTLWSASRLELVLETVPGNLMINPYEPPQYNGIFYSVARASSNGSSNKTYSIRRIGFWGPKKVAVWKDGGSIVLFKKSEANVIVRASISSNKGSEETQGISPVRGLNKTSPGRNFP